MTISSARPRVGSPTLHATIVFTISVFVAVLVMAYLFKVEIVAKGIGKVVPLGRVQIVQPEFGGQITAIRVRDGQHVTKGEVVITLDPTNARAALNTLEAERDRLKIERLRIETVLDALATTKALDHSEVARRVAAFNVTEPLGKSAFFKEQRALLNAELTELIDALEQVDARQVANEKSKYVTQAGIERIDAALQTQQERLGIAQSLLERGTASRATYLDVLDGFNRLEKERDVYFRELDQKSALTASYIAERASLVSGQRSQLQARKAQLEARMFEVAEELVTTQRQLTNTKLTAPETGIVDQLSVFTVGGIVDASEELLRIVPEGQAFEVEAMFPNTDVGFLDEGQKANIKLDAYPSERFGSLRGHVTNVSADAIEIGEGAFGFTVRITPDSSILQTAGTGHIIQTGMTATVDVITGKRRLISYFFAPIVKVVQESMGER